jgi:hypothetical protein
LLSQRKNPVIRYHRKSDLCDSLATELNSIIRSERELFHFGDQNKGSGDAVLLILDRRDDPVTPLLQNWTYHALVHEHFTIKDNRVNMKAVPNIQKDMNEIVLASHQDKFFRDAMFLNYGELGVKVKNLAVEYQEKTKSTVKIDTIEDMKRFMDKYPEFREFASNASKHVAIVSEIFRLTNAHDLLRVSEVSQHLATTENHIEAVRLVKEIIASLKVPFENKLHVVMLYALRYETERGNQIASFKQALQQSTVNPNESARANAIDEILRISGDKQRGGIKLFDNKGVFAAIADSFTAVAEVVGMKGMENVYTKHKPILNQIVEQTIKGKIDTAMFPSASLASTGFMSSNSAGSARDVAKPTDCVYVYIIGGATYAEANALKELTVNTPQKPGYPNAKLFLGGSCIHNSRTYVDDLIEGSDVSNGKNAQDIPIEPLNIGSGSSSSNGKYQPISGVGKRSISSTDLDFS